MIDWLTFVIKVPHKYITGGFVQSIDAEGVSEWVSEKKAMKTGSYDDKLTMKTDMQPSGFAGKPEQWLYVSGNPSKWIQGHNVFGTDCVCSLVMHVGAYLYGFGFLDEAGAAMWKQKALTGDFMVKKVDVNYSLKLNNQTEVQHWLRACEKTATMQHRGRAQAKKGTVYFGFGSKRWLSRMYSKHEELKAHPPKCPEGPELLKFTENLLRVEISVKSLELERLKLTTGADWIPEGVPRDLWCSKLEGLNMVTAVTDEKIALMPKNTAMIYTVWKSGVDIHSQVKDGTALISRPTFYRHKKVLMELGIDIGGAPPDMSHNVVPLLRVLEAKPVDCPWWVPLASEVDRNLLGVAA